MPRFENLPLATKEETVNYLKKNHGFHAALIGRSKHGKTSVAGSLTELFDNVEVLDTDGGTMSSNKQFQRVKNIAITPCKGVEDLANRVAQTKADLLIVDSISAALDQSKVESIQGSKDNKNRRGKDQSIWQHANYANSLFIELSENIREVCRYRGKVVVSLCGVKDMWEQDGTDRRYVGFRADLSAANADKYNHACDMFLGQVREPTKWVDPSDGLTKWNYEELRYLTILKPTPSWHFVGFRASTSFTNKIPPEINNFNLARFLRAFVYDINNPVIEKEKI